MKTLETMIYDDGNLYEQIKRHGNIALYNIRIPADSPVNGYETWKIQIDSSGNELFPASEDFGQAAWSWSSREQAEKHFDQLCSASSSQPADNFSMDLHQVISKTVNHNRPVGDHQYCGYMRKYKDTYTLKRMEDGVWAIKLRDGGDIVPDSIGKGTLLATVFFHSKGSVIYHIRTLPAECVERQHGSNFISFSFDESKLPEIARLFKACKKWKKNLTDEQRKAIAERFKKHGKETTIEGTHRTV